MGKVRERKWRPKVGPRQSPGLGRDPHISTETKHDSRSRALPLDRECSPLGREQHASRPRGMSREHVLFSGPCSRSRAPPLDRDIASRSKYFSATRSRPRSPIPCSLSTEIEGHNPTVTFAEEEAMRSAIEGMNGQTLDGRQITVNEAQSRGSGGGGRGGYGGGRGDGGYSQRREGGGGYGGGGYGGGGGGYGQRSGGGGGGGYGGGERYSRGNSDGNWRN